MKLIHALNLCLLAVCACTNATAQCTGNCPVGSLSVPNSSATLTAGSTYCISSSADLSANSYTVNGTLVIQAGSVSLGAVAIEKTGVILVKNGARLTITGNITGNTTAPVSAIDNLVVCSGGLVNMIGSFSQGQINIAVNDLGSFLVTGAWTAGAQLSKVKIGKGAVIELCASFNINKDGFFTETSSDPSYLVVHGGMTQSNFGGGWLSTSQNSSKIKWTTSAQSAFISHPAGNSCSPCSNFNMAPTGTNNNCGSAANALYNTVLAAPDKPVVRFNEALVDQPVVYPNPANNYLYLQLPKNHHYIQLSLYTQSGQLTWQTPVLANTSPTRYSLPAYLQPGLYVLKLTGSTGILTFKVVKD